MQQQIFQLALALNATAKAQLQKAAALLGIDINNPINL